MWRMVIAASEGIEGAEGIVDCNPTYGGKGAIVVIASHPLFFFDKRELECRI